MLGSLDMASIKVHEEGDEPDGQIEIHVVSLLATKGLT